MRALLVHPGCDFSVSDVHDGWLKGLRANGVEVATLNLSDRLNFYGGAKIQHGDEYIAAFHGSDVARMAAIGMKAAVYDWWPDVIIVVSSFFIPSDFYPVFRDRGHKVVILHTESPYEDPKQIERAELADLNIINDPTNLDAFQQVAPTAYIPHAYDPDRHHPRPTDPDCESDFCFVGTGYASRIKFFESVDWNGINARFAGNWQQLPQDSELRDFLVHPVDECCPNDETVRLYTSSKVSANVYRKEAMRPDLEQGWSMTPREVELAACGVFFLRDPRPESDELLPMLPTFQGAEEFGDLVRYWSARDAEREAAAQAARAAVSDRTFDNHAALMLQQLGL